MPEDLYDRVQTELWFALRAWVEYDYIKGMFGLDTTSLYPQVSNRWFRATGKKSKVESKEEYEARNQTKSPDDADALTLLVHGVRLASQVTLGMTPENTTADGYSEDDDGEGYHRVDATNRRDDLED